MDEKTLHILEYFKILDRLAEFTAFSASAELARSLKPLTDLEEIQRLQAETREALLLQVTNSDLTIGGARDVRQPVELAVRGGVLDPGDLLDVKSTLVSARTLSRKFDQMSKNPDSKARRFDRDGGSRSGDEFSQEGQFPYLVAIVSRMTIPGGIIEAITRTLSERGEILDSASVKLATIRRDQRIVYERLMTKLQRMVSDTRNSTYLQEAIITQRDGRFVIPLRSEFKGRIKSIVHDQSASGATLFIEPIGVVDLNNQYRELQLAERDEERRILTELSDMVGSSVEAILNCVYVIADLDLALARGKYAEKINAIEPVVKPIRTKPWAEVVEGRAHPGSVIRLFQARHPLLNPEGVAPALAGVPANAVVPVDVELDEYTYALVITGPNTGGKTVTLKTVGLLALMAQSGLHIPALAGSEISLFETIYADIGDEQSIEQSLSTFSSHITNIKRILEKANRRSLVILDELGAGTDPSEGAALARALLSHLLQRGITTLVTTHHPELKAFAHGTPGVVNASVEFDIKTLQPTFHLTIGLPGRSNALAIAQRLGIPKAIINDARMELDPDEARAEDLLNEIHHQREQARKARSDADRTRSLAENLRNELVKRLDEIEDERSKILDEARLESEKELSALREQLKDVRMALARAKQPAEALEVIEEQLDEIEVTAATHRNEKPVERIQQEVDFPQRRALRLGDKVHLRTLGTQGIITSMGENEAEVSVGMLRVRTRLSDLALAAKSGETGVEPVSTAGKQPRGDLHPGSAKKEESTTINVNTYTPSPGLELNLRGKRTDEALDDLDRYLDSAFMAGLPYVRIIHGKGTGKLRAVVHDTLRTHSYVKSFELGGEKEGGEGVTVAKLIGN